jgi:hypothetical protein
VLINSENHNFWEHNKNSLYILRDSCYTDIVETFTKIQDVDTKVVRGSSQKSHLVSGVDFRLSCYLMILFNMDYQKVYKQNAFNDLTKDRYLPSR